MVFSSFESAIEAIRSEMFDVDFDLVSGADAARLVSLLTPFKNQFDGFVLAASARAVVANQHNVDGARSGAAWVASKTGVSEKQARAELALNRQLDELPDLGRAVRFGGLSLAKASAIGSAAQGDESIASSLLSVASSGTVEMIDLRAREIRSAQANESRRERLRKSQFVNIGVNSDSMVTGSFRLLPELAVGILESHRRAQGSTSYERAESFAELVTSSLTTRVPSLISGTGPQSGSQKAESEFQETQAGSRRKTEVVFHLDVTPENLELTNKCELKGVGPVPVQSAIDLFEEASFKLIGTSNNKLVWFSEKNRRSSSSPLPEYIKRAVKAKAYNRCEVQGCINTADEVDHKQPRCNNGINDPENLQALCEQDHHAKTKQDAPWTTGAIYGKDNQEKRKRSKQKVPAEAEDDHAA